MVQRVLDAAGLARLLELGGGELGDAFCLNKLRQRVSARQSEGEKRVLQCRRA